MDRASSGSTSRPWKRGTGSEGSGSGVMLQVFAFYSSSQGDVRVLATLGLRPMISMMATHEAMSTVHPGEEGDALQAPPSSETEDRGLSLLDLDRECGRSKFRAIRGQDLHGPVAAVPGP